MSDNFTHIEWKECRESISRFDNFLFKIRSTGITVLIIIILSPKIVDSIGCFQINKDSMTQIAFSIFQISIIILFCLDRFYDRLQIGAILKAIKIESIYTEEFNIGLTTEIEMFKEKNEIKNKFYKKFKSIATGKGVTPFYVVIINSIYLTAVALVSTLYLCTILPNECKLNYIAYISFVIISLSSCCIISISHNLMRDPYKRINERKSIIMSKVLYTANDIKSNIFFLSKKIDSWIGASGNVYIISILFGSKRFTELLLHELEKRNKNRIYNVIYTKLEGSGENTNGNLSKLAITDVSNLAIDTSYPVLIVDDLARTGNSINAITKKIILLGVNKNNIKSCVLIKKFKNIEFNIDYVCFDLSLDNKYKNSDNQNDDGYRIFGFGMDINDDYREINHIGILTNTAFPNIN